jgi:hypothetical protein
VTNWLDNVPAGHPGFRVRDPAPLRPTPATLRRVALAKLSSVEFFSASLGGESFVFAPWLTTLIDYGTSMRFVGVYRTDPFRDDDEEPTPADPRWLCIRRSEWIREADLERASRANDLGEYLASGPQIADSYVFGTTQAQPYLVDVTRRTLADFAYGITIAATATRQADWQEVSVEVADDSLATTVNYSPLTARSDVLESGLPPWLEIAEAAVAQGGTRPDGEITLNIRRSVPEIVTAPFRAPR